MSSLRRILVAVVVFVALGGLMTAPANAQSPSGSEFHIGGIQRMRGASTAAPAPASNPPNMVYHGGPVLPNSTVYAIWWGNPSDFPADEVEAIDNFYENLDGSDFLHIADQYMLGNTAHTRFGGNLFDSSQPTSNPVTHLKDLGLELQNVTRKYGITLSPSDIFMVFTSNFPAENLAAGLCAFHAYAYDTTTGALITTLAYVPNSTSVPLDCGTNEDPLFTPNHYSEGTRAIASVAAHEFMETITDPQVNAWFNTDGNEVGDLCIYIYQRWVPLVDSKWKIQEIWSNQASGCVQGAGPQGRVLGAVSSPGTLKTFDILAAIYGTFSQSINGNGAIVGSYTDALNASHAFLRDESGHITTIDPQGTNDSLLQGAEALSINSVGSIVGLYFDANSVAHGFVRDKSGTFVTIDVPGASTTSGATGTRAVSINHDGVIAGRYEDANFVRHGFVRDTLGNITTFDAGGVGDVADSGTQPLSINGEGAITGNFRDAHSVSHGFVRDKYGNITIFDAPGASTAQGAGTFAYSINDGGQIAGYYTDANFVSHGYVRDPHGLISTFDAPNAVYGTFAYGINVYGVIAGYYSDSSGFPHGFVRDEYGNFTEIEAASSSYGTVVLSINDAGTAAGYHTAILP